MTDLTAVILLIEGRSDNQTFATAIKKAGYHPEKFQTNANALKWALQNKPDLIVFDSSSMRSNGLRSCRRLRQNLGDIPIIHCRAEGVPHDDRIEAKAYLEQPFTPRKLLNRIRALLPADDSKEEVVRCGYLKLYPSKRSVDVNGQGERALTPKLVMLLEEFIRHPNQVVSRKQLMKSVWQTDYIGDTRTLDVHIRWVREQIEENPANPKILRTVRGKGYIFDMPSLTEETPSEEPSAKEAASK